MVNDTPQSTCFLPLMMSRNSAYTPILVTAHTDLPLLCSGGEGQIQSG